MSDDKSGHDEVRLPRIHSERLDRWEGEGGSLCRLIVPDGPDGHPRDPYSRPDQIFLDALPVGVLITDLDGRVSYANPACHELYAASASELLGTHWLQTIDARDRAAIPTDWQERCQQHRSLTFEVRVITGAGRRIWTRHRIASLNSTRTAAGRIHTIENISAIKATEQAVKSIKAKFSRERERARVTLESIGDAVISTDADGRVTYLNAVAENLTGWSREQAAGQAFSRVFRVVDSDTGKVTRNPAEQAMESLQIVEMPANCLLKRLDGSELAIEDSAAPIMDAQGRLTGAVVVFRDRKMSRESTDRMAHMARHDALTGLPNRIAFAEHFDHAIKLARRHHKQVGLLFIDLDRFKQVNDSLGHEAGDHLLKRLSERLVSCIRATDIVCRHGGDEFVVLLGEVERAEDAGSVARKILSAAAQPIRVENHPVKLRLSIGISLYPEHGSNLETLLTRADAAMYHAKNSSAAGYRLFRAGMKQSRPGLPTAIGLNVVQRTDDWAFSEE